MTFIADKAGRILEGGVEKFYPLFFSLVIALCLFNFFYHLGQGQVWDWDEARYGINAYEMAQSHDYGICTYAHGVDHSNLKPPLAPWAILLGYRLFGFNTFGLRFYSAVSCLLIVAVMMWFVAAKSGKIQALLSGLILATTSPFLFNHGARTGDYCSFFTLFFVLFMVCLYHAEENGRYFVLAGLCLAGGFLSYSYHSLQMVVLMAAYLAWTKGYRRISAKYYAGFALCAVLPALGWAVWRMSYPDGREFVRFTFYYDVLQRASREIEGHTGTIDYYLSFIGTQNLFWSIYLGAVLFSCFAVVPWRGDGKNRFVPLIALGFLVPLVLFSAARSKLSWYVDPLYPSLAMILGWATCRLLKEPNCQKTAKVVIPLLFIVFFCRSEREIVRSLREAGFNPSQKLLVEFREKAGLSLEPIYEVPDWPQGDRFVAEVQCGLNPQASNSLEDCLTRKGFLMLRKTAGNVDFVARYTAKIVLQNTDWAILKLP